MVAEALWVGAEVMQIQPVTAVITAVPLRSPVHLQQPIPNNTRTPSDDVLHNRLGVALQIQPNGGREANHAPNNQISWGRPIKCSEMRICQ